MQVPGPLVETGWLADNQGQVVILDVRQDAGSFLGAPPAPGKKPDLKKLTGHIPGAVSVPWKKIATKSGEQGKTLKAMLPSPDAFAALMQDSGVGNDSAVIVVGRGASAKDQAFATRLYFTLKYFGHDNVALLNGGVAQWAKEGRPLAYTETQPEKGSFTVTEIRGHLVADTEQVESAVSSGGVQLADCRTEDFYLGLNFKRKFVKPEHKGRLAGARTLPFVLLADNSGPAKLFPAEQIRGVARVKGIELEAPTITYCNTGVTASLGWFALHELLGNESAQLYDGSMHAWSSLDPSHQVVALGRPQTGKATAEEDEAGTGLQRVAVVQPRSLQSLVDERREVMRRRRNEQMDAISGRRLFQPAWLAVHEKAMDDHRDRMRTTQRMQREEARRYSDAMRDFYAPWTRPLRDRAQLQSYLSQMRQLDRQEYHDSLFFARASAPW
jgi:thiosulfate/3-mercaptopyruvate sulfurtransferase